MEKRYSTVLACLAQPFDASPTDCATRRTVTQDVVSIRVSLSPQDYCLSCAFCYRNKYSSVLGHNCETLVRRKDNVR